MLSRSTDICCRLSSGNPAQRFGLTELVPYSGILNIGAHHAQPVANGAPSPLLHFDDERSFLSSQEPKVADAILTSASMSTCANYKRRRSEEDREDEYADFTPLLPRSGYPLCHTKMPNLNTLRVVANSKTRKTMQHQLHKISQEENINMTNASDIEEADFSRPEDWATPEMKLWIITLSSRPHSGPLVWFASCGCDVHSCR